MAEYQIDLEWTGGTLALRVDYDETQATVDGDGNEDLTACDLLGAVTVTVTGGAVRVTFLNPAGNVRPGWDQTLAAGVHVLPTGGPVKDLGDLLKRGGAGVRLSPAAT